MLQTLVTMLAAVIAAIYTFSNYRRREAIVVCVRESITFNNEQLTLFRVGENNVDVILFSHIGHAGVEIFGRDGEHLVVPWAQVLFVNMPSGSLTKHVSKLRFWG